MDKCIHCGSADSPRHWLAPGVCFDVADCLRRQLAQRDDQIAAMKADKVRADDYSKALNKIAGSHVEYGHLAKVVLKQHGEFGKYPSDDDYFKDGEG